METCRMSRKGQRMERSCGEENGPFEKQRKCRGACRTAGRVRCGRGQEGGGGPDRRACGHCEGCTAAKPPSRLPDGKALGEVEKANIRWATKQSCFCTLTGQDASKERSPLARAGLGSSHMLGLPPSIHSPLAPPTPACGLCSWQSRPENNAENLRPARAAVWMGFYL